MDARTFDQWSIAVARRPTRRTALRLLGGGLLGGLLAQRRHRAARAAQPCEDWWCTGAVEQFPGADVPLTCADLGLEDCAGICCNADETCIGGICQGIVVQPGTDIGVLLTCEGQGLWQCDGYCADIEIDPANCGGCRVVCGAGEACIGGACVPPPVGNPCAAGLTDCGGTCVDLAGHAGHCGACFNSCPLGGVCQGGVCGGLICLDGLTNCYGACVDIYSDPDHCGGCEYACYVDGATCVNGQCVS
jgi:hypothetical protein